MYLEGEWRTAIMEPGTLFAPVTGIPQEKRQELSAKPSAMIHLTMVINMHVALSTCHSYSIIASVVVNYGRGTNPILPLSIQCANGTSTFSDCSTTELDVNQCAQAAGVDCFGTAHYNFATNFSIPP